ncbi:MULTISPECIES: histidine kinase N-terminal domain-containing protein [Bacillaceae]|uniref:histidine kinase N-terminal domain-containing protein n=1 Tax=Bacillaceae TaxID=186817 RepID=UPI001F441D13|nr:MULTISPECIES: histidine kinase N-terminal domain-containing protein [Bacillaceae]
MEPTIDHSKDCSKVITYHLLRNESHLLYELERDLLVSENDILKEKMKENVRLIVQLVIETINDEISEEYVKQLAYEVALERMGAGVNIGDFVFNINLARSTITKFIIESGVTHHTLSLVLGKTNDQFNLFCYQVVSEYTKLKDLELKEKTSFIQQTHKDRLAILGQISSSFVHEFRNPLTSVIGFSKLLRKEFSSHPYLDIIDKELDQLNFRITQFLHTSKMDAADNTYEEVDLCDLLEDILKFLYPSIVSNDVKINAHLERNLKLVANKEELKQVFLNILFNSIDAVKQNHKERNIEVICKVSGNGQSFQIKIINNGPVIPTSIRETIFEPFYTTKETGTGIGLFVCKKIVEKLNGNISCESNENETIFSIQLASMTVKQK